MKCRILSVWKDKFLLRKPPYLTIIQVVFVPDSFWQEFRKHVKEANPEAIILAEHYGDPSSWLAGDQWDTVMNYDAFMEPLTWFLT